MALCMLFTAVQCDQPPAPPPAVVQATLKERPLSVGTSFRASLSAESVVPRFLSKQKAKRMGQIRPVDTRTTVETTFYAELIEVTPEKWRIDFEQFKRTTQTVGAEEATSTHELPDRAFFIEFLPEETIVLDEHGALGTESQTQYTFAVAQVLRERHAWGKFAASRSFGQGKIVEASKGLVPGRFVESMFGKVSDGHSTVSFFRFGEDAAKREVAHFDVHSRFKATPEEMTDGSYFDFEATAKTVLRVADGLQMSQDVSAKVTPRASTGAMLPEGSGSWKLAFAIDAATLQVP